MFNVVRTTIRPTKGIAWWPGSDLLRETVTKSKDSGDLLFEHWDTSADGLTMVYTAYWKSEAVWQAYSDDPVLVPVWNDRELYHSHVGITSTRVTQNV